MNERTLVDPITIDVGFMPRHRLLEAFREGHVHLNEMASTLLDHVTFDEPKTESVTVIERTVSELGLVSGAALPQIFEAAQERGLQPCPPTTGPYLRLVLDSQATAPDAVMSNGKAPSGSLTVAAPPFQIDEDYPKGFYLRVISGRLWLRGYRCSSTEHIWDPGDRFIFSSQRGSQLAARRSAIGCTSDNEPAAISMMSSKAASLSNVIRYPLMP